MTSACRLFLEIRCKGTAKKIEHRVRDTPDVWEKKCYMRARCLFSAPRIFYNCIEDGAANPQHYAYYDFKEKRQIVHVSRSFRLSFDSMTLTASWIVFSSIEEYPPHLADNQRITEYSLLISIFSLGFVFKNEWIKSIIIIKRPCSIKKSKTGSPLLVCFEFANKLICWLFIHAAKVVKIIDICKLKHRILFY